MSLSVNSFFCQWYVKTVLMSWLKPVAFCVCSVQQNGQIPCNQPLPLYGYDIYHLSAKGGLWLQGQHCAAGKQIRTRGRESERSLKYENLYAKWCAVFHCIFKIGITLSVGKCLCLAHINERHFCHSVQQLAKKVNNVETSWALGATFDYFRNLNIH